MLLFRHAQMLLILAVFVANPVNSTDQGITYLNKALEDYRKSKGLEDRNEEFINNCFLSKVAKTIFQYEAAFRKLEKKPHYSASEVFAALSTQSIELLEKYHPQKSFGVSSIQCYIKYQDGSSSLTGIGVFREVNIIHFLLEALEQTPDSDRRKKFEIQQAFFGLARKGKTFQGLADYYECDYKSQLDDPQEKENLEIKVRPYFKLIKNPANKSKNLWEAILEKHEQEKKPAKVNVLDAGSSFTPVLGETDSIPENVLSMIMKRLAAGDNRFSVEVEDVLDLPNPTVVQKQAALKESPWEFSHFNLDILGQEQEESKDKLSANQVNEHSINSEKLWLSKESKDKNEEVCFGAQRIPGEDLPSFVLRLINSVELRVVKKQQPENIQESFAFAAVIHMSPSLLYQLISSMRGSLERGWEQPEPLQTLPEFYYDLCSSVYPVNLGGGQVLELSIFDLRNLNNQPSLVFDSKKAKGKAKIQFVQPRETLKRIESFLKYLDLDDFQNLYGKDLLLKPDLVLQWSWPESLFGAMDLPFSLEGLYALSLQNQLAETSEQNEDLDGQLQKLNTENDLQVFTTPSLKELTDEILAQESSLAKLKEDSKLLQDQVKLCREQNSKACESLRREKQQLQAEVDEATRALAEQRQKVTQLNDELRHFKEKEMNKALAEQEKIIKSNSSKLNRQQQSTRRIEEEFAEKMLEAGRNREENLKNRRAFVELTDDFRRLNAEIHRTSTAD